MLEERPPLADVPGLRRLPLARAVQVALGACVVLVLFGSSSVGVLVDVGSPLRWLALAAFAVLAIAWAAAEGVTAWELSRAGAPVLLLAALGLASTAWSVAPLRSFESGVVFSLLALGVGAAAAATRGRVEEVESLAQALVLAMLAVSIAGALVYVVAPAQGAQAAEPGTAFRFSGLGQSPNTVPMLAALAVPLSAWLSLVRHGRLRLLYALTIAALSAEIAASGSRGAALALPAAALVFAAAAPGRRRRRLVLALVGLAVAGAVIAGNRVMQDATALPPAVVPPASGRAAPASFPRIVLRPFDDELGTIPSGGRALFGKDGRALAWQGAFDEGSERAVVGWGFGTETRVFIERVYQFHSKRAEDSYFGLYLELGAAGVLVWLLAAGLVGGAIVRARPLEPRTRLALAGAAASVVVGYGLGVGQSYVYSAGDVGTLPFWLAVALAIALGAAGRAPSGVWPRRLALAAVAAVAAAIPLGIWEGANARAGQNAGIEAVWQHVGSRLAGPSLDGFRIYPGWVDCLLYAAGGSPGGYELCFQNGRVVQAFDRRNGEFHVWTLKQWGPSAASLRVPQSEVDVQLRRLGAFKPGVIVGAGYQTRQVG